MHELEIDYFLEGLKFIQGKFFIDAIEQFKKIVTNFPDSELADDAEYNISLCYYELNQFDSAILNLNKLIKDYPDATITVLGAGNEFGRTAAKSYLLMINCYLALGELEKTSEILSLMEPDNDSYIITDGVRVTYHLDSRPLITRREGLPPNHHTAVFVFQGSHPPGVICPAVRSIQ